MSVWCRLLSAFGILAFSLVSSTTALSRPPSYVPGRYFDNREISCERFQFSSYSDSGFATNSYGSLRFPSVCGWEGFAHNKDHWYRHPSRPTVERVIIGDPIQAELSSAGTNGATIEKARLAILKILEQNNSCSNWLRQSEPNPADIFRRVHYTIDDNGQKYVLKLQAKNDNWYYQEPYAASVMQRSSPPVLITINAGGAFFKSSAAVQSYYKDGASAGMSVAKRLGIEIYTGGTLHAQVLILLHELAHVLDAIPADSLSKGDLWLSDRNTETVLRFCRAQVESATK
jgi:hypothetical protein